MTEKDFIPIIDTPYVSKLAKDFLLGKDIGINNPLLQNYDEIAEKAKSRDFSQEKRNLLVNTLLDQYKKGRIELDTNSKVYQNIQSLKDSNIFTFTTGQQIHIFLGPLFFIYKIKSLLRHVKNFNENNGDFKVVPVFWMASEDHDLEEINYVKLYGETFKWEAEPGNAVGRISCKGLPELIDRIEARADKTDENKDFFVLLKKHYTNEKSLAEASRSILHEIFEEDGLIIFNPDDKILKQHFFETAKKEIEGKILFNSYNEQNSLLKKHGYEPRVNAQEINYFWLEGLNRVKLKIKESKIVKGDWNDEINLDQIYKNTENLSPNVIARPLYQETILPNVLYIGGSAEIEYWLPLQTAFEKLELPFPALLQRDSVINITKKNFEIIEKGVFNWYQLFNTEKELADEFSRTENENAVSKKLNRIQIDFKKLHLDLETKEIKSGQVFKEFNEIEKSISKLANLIGEEELKRQKGDPILNRILKIKEKLFDKKREKEDFLVSNPTILRSLFDRNTEFESIMHICKM